MLSRLRNASRELIVMKCMSKETIRAAEPVFALTGKLVEVTFQFTNLQDIQGKNTTHGGNNDHQCGNAIALALQNCALRSQDWARIKCVELSFRWSCIVLWLWLGRYDESTKLANAMSAYAGAYGEGGNDPMSGTKTGTGSMAPYCY